jgi:hypothetical protein
VKIALLLTILIGITFLGCSDNSDNPLAPNSFTNEKITSLIPSNPSDLNDSTLERNPNGHRTGDNTDLKKLSVSKSINGEWGGWVILDTNYTDIEGSDINVYARLRILPGAYQGIINIEMTLDLTDASVQFFPEMAFDRDVRYDIWFQGIDLRSLDYKTGDLDFAYFAENGDVEQIETTDSNVNLLENKITAVNARLYHFSRYGWIR